MIQSMWVSRSDRKPAVARVASDYAKHLPYMRYVKRTSAPAATTETCSYRDSRCVATDGERSRRKERTSSASRSQGDFTGQAS